MGKVEKYKIYNPVTNNFCEIEMDDKEVGTYLHHAKKVEARFNEKRKPEIVEDANE